MHRLRMLTVAVALSLLAAACGSDSLIDLEPSPQPDATATAVPGDGDQSTGDEGGDGNADVGDDATGDDDGSDAGEGQDGTGGDEATDDSGAEDGGDGDGGDAAESGPTTEVTDGGMVGANAAAYLRGDRPRVVLEIDLQEGVNFPDSAVAHVREVLARESASTVEVTTGAATSTRRDQWTPDQLRAAAAETRNVAHSDDTAVLHVLVLRDAYEDDAVLGLAFGSSSAVVFPDQWSDLTTALLSGDRIARAVTTHEVGHLLGLVGLYEEPVNDHEDPDHPGHTTDSDDVMYYAVERDVISQLDGIPTDFGELTRADLAAIREG